MNLSDELSKAAKASGIALSARLLETASRHHALLVRWNKVHNLTRVVEPAEAARVHYLDCWAPLLGWAPPKAFMDIGSGAGFPGLLAAALWPDAEALLVDNAEKRASFLRLAAAELGLRVEVTAATDRQAGVILSRATFSPGARWTLGARVAAGGRLALWGHANDSSTWNQEVATWVKRSPMWDRATTRTEPYEIPGLPGRALLVATPVFPVEHTI